MKNKKKTLWIILGVVAVIIIIAAIAGGGDDSTTSTETTDSSTQKEWVEIARLTGSGDKKSDIFTYDGGKARLKYEFNGDEDFGMLMVYVVKEGQDVMRDGGFPELTINGSDKGESSLSHLRKGNYYLNATSANGKWVVTVEVLK